jgi:hypothetical protein
MNEYHNHTQNIHNPYNMCVLKVQSPQDFDLAIEYLKVTCVTASNSTVS